MAKYDYIFVDESGDPGYATHPETGALLSSPFFAMAALHVTDDSYSHIIRHLAAFRNRNLRIPAPINVTHASSLYVEALQVVDHIANAYGTEELGGTGHDSLRFVRALDITTG